VWAGSFVEETSLTKNISILRKLLGEAFPEVEAIRTISKRGYQLTIEVSRETEEVPHPEPPIAQPPVEVAAAPIVAVQIPVPRRSPLRWWALGAMTVIIASLGVWTVRARLLPKPIRSSVAVISFHDLSGKPENAWLSRAVSEMLTTELDADSKLRTLPGDVTARLRADLALPDQNGYSTETLGRIRRAAECDYVITGSYLVMDGNVRLDVRVQDTAKPESAAAMSFSATERDLPQLAVQAGAAIRTKFGVPKLSASEEAKVRLSLPSDEEARRKYSEALEKLRLFDPAAAKQLLDQVVALEPGFAGGHMALSTALLQLGYQLKARDEALRARDLSSGLPREERLAVEARYQETAGQWDKAADIYNSLWTFYPDETDFAISLARVQSRSGKGQMAEDTLFKLRATATPSALARLELASAETEEARAEYAKASVDYKGAIDQARKVGARVLEGRANAGLALTLEKAGDIGGSRAAWKEAIRICSDVGDSGCVANALNNQAVALMDDGDHAAALKTLDQVLDLTRKNGNRGEEGRALNIQGLLLFREGDFAKAHQSLEQCLAIARETADPRLTGIALRRLGDVAASTGDEPTAIKLYAEEMHVARQTDNKGELATALDSLGRIEQRQGDLAGARRDLEESLSLKRQLGNDSLISTTLTYLANVSRNQGDLDAARKLRTEECKLAESTNRKTAVPRCLVAVAEIDLLRGKAAEAAAAVQPIAEATKSTSVGAESYRVLALTRLDTGDKNGAKEAIRRAQSFAAKSQDLQITTPVLIASGRVESALGHSRESSVLLAKATEQAKRADIMSLTLETRLAVAEAAVRDGNPAARKQLTELIADSTQRGYGLFAGRAQKLLSTLK
jgi:tetratricopeptide (TPR) repeat protein